MNDLTLWLPLLVGLAGVSAMVAIWLWMKSLPQPPQSGAEPSDIIGTRERTEGYYEELAYNWVHDLSSPLQSLWLGLHNLSSEVEDRQLRSEIRGLVHECASLVRLTDEIKQKLLTPSSEDQRREIVNIYELCQDVIKTFGKAGRLWYQGPLNPSPIFANKEQLRQVVLGNLVGNAINHAIPKHKQLEIEFRVVEEGDYLCVSILDNGPGFPSEEERFGHSTPSTEPLGVNKLGHMGRGLSNAHRVISQHGGDFERGNRSKGGAYVTFKLPIHRHW